MSNTDLFKQAIAEAKTIREAAIANAKEALEESLTPHLKGMLAAKLQEMEAEEAYEEEVVNEEDLINDPKGPTAHGNIAEEEAEEEEKEEAEEENAEEGEEEAEEEKEEEAEEEIDLENMTVEDLTDLIKDIIDQELGHEDSEEELSHDAEIAPDMEDASADEEEIDINEILAELEGHEEEGDEHFELFAVEEPESNVDYEGPSHSDDLQAAALEILKANPDLTYGEAIAKVKAEVVEEEEMEEETWEEGSSEMEEALATIDELKKQLHEVNLLNAKLLYVNKIFKDNSLSESQKVNVVAAFDKAETVKEVKLVYETVSKNVTAKTTVVKEHKSFASKPVGATKVPQNTEIISEVSDTVKRLQKLAGII